LIENWFIFPNAAKPIEKSRVLAELPF
jgi:hypothetical protein